MSARNSYAGLIAGQAPILRSNRLQLRPLRRDDAPKIQHLLDDFEVVKWMGRIPHPYTISNAIYFIDQVAPTELYWVAEITEQEVIGLGGFTFETESSGVELGYWFGQDHWGQGYATDVVRLMLAHAWDAGAQRVFSGCFDGNGRSQHVLEKCGFRVVGNSMRFNLARDTNLLHIDMIIERPTQTNAAMS